METGITRREERNDGGRNYEAEERKDRGRNHEGEERNDGGRNHEGEERNDGDRNHVMWFVYQIIKHMVSMSF